MKQIISSVLIALTIVCAICCSKIIIQPPDTTNSDDYISSNSLLPDDDSLSYKLQQKHFTTWHQIIHYFGSDHEEHRIVDTNLAWLEFSNGQCSDSILFLTILAPQCTQIINCEKPEEYLNTVITYDNGFKFKESLVSCWFEIESSDSLNFRTDSTNITLPPPVPQYCQITPISIHIRDIRNKCLQTTLKVEIYHPDNVLTLGMENSTVASTETMEIPLAIPY